VEFIYPAYHHQAGQTPNQLMGFISAYAYSQQIRSMTSEVNSGSMRWDGGDTAMAEFSRFTG
jgi:hypothetical protein